jgi:hypothetical protein
MFTRQQILERIEGAQTTTPFCEQCGQPTKIADRGDALWLECASLAHRRGRLQTILRFDFATLHTQRPVIDLCIAA